MSFSDPVANIKELNLRFGEKVADLGAGVGVYTVVAARTVGPDGKVYAIDVQKDLLTRVKAEADRVNLHNVEVVWGDVERVGGSGLADNSIDVAIIANLLFQTKSAYTVAQEVKRILRPAGRILVIDWSESFGNMGPQSTDVLSKEKARQIFIDAGFVFDHEFVAGDEHYGLIFKKS